MEKHAMALGYFFLATFCIVNSAHTVPPLALPLLLAGLVAGLVGLRFFVSACASRIKSRINLIKNWFVEMARLVPLARELPPHPSTFREDHPA